MKDKMALINCNICNNPINIEKFSSYFFCSEHTQYLCNACAYLGFYCTVCQGNFGAGHEKYTGLEYKNLHIAVKAAIIMILISVIVLIVLSAYFIFLIPFDFNSMYIPIFAFIFFLSIALIFLNTTEPNKNYLKRSNINSEDRALINAYGGLEGDWQNPIVSKDVRLKVYSKAHQKANWMILFVTVIGCILTIFGFILTYQVLVFIGSLLVSGGVMLFWFYIYLKIKFVLTEPVETLVELRTQNLAKVLKLLDGFIAKTKEPYYKNLSRLTARHYLWVNNYKYIFQNSNYIIIGLTSLSGLEPSVAVGIGYFEKAGCHTHGRLWQKRLDEFLSKKKLMLLYKSKIY